MEPVARCAERALRRHVHPALRLAELVELVAERVDRSLDVHRLRAVLESHPDRFRLLDPWRGPWSTARPDSDVASTAGDVWVVAITDPEDPPDGAGPNMIKLRESVRWLGRGIDPRSSTEVSRWYAIALAERKAREAVARRAA